MANSAIPQNFQEWHHCITVECGLALTPDYIESRIASLKNEKDHYTQQFIKLYGREYLLTVLSWFVLAQKNS